MQMTQFASRFVAATTACALAWQTLSFCRAAEKAQSRPAAQAEATGDVASPVVRIGSEQIAAQKITTTRLRHGALSRHLAVAGSLALDADRVVQVPARVVGTVAEMRKRLGDDVVAGEVVSALDSREVADAKSEYLTAATDLDLQRTLFERSKALWEKRVAPENQYLQVQNTFAQTSLRVDLARQKLSALGIDSDAVRKAFERPGSGESLRRYELRAPIGGRVIARKVDVGTAVGKEGEPAAVYAIADLSVLWVELAVPTADLAEVREGAAVMIATAGDAPRRGEAQVVFVSPVVDPDTRNARVVARVSNADFSWRPGTFVDAEIAGPESAPQLIVPKAAVLRIGGADTVFVRTAEGFAARKVQLGRADDGSFEIASGAAAGEEVAVGNAFLLKAELGKAEAEGD